ncbi:MAG: hypothetical protein OEY10_00435 [Nitrosopumilus sp.]|nr:hypothetical protein [Nitrosopumilus sp.]
MSDRDIDTLLQKLDAINTRTARTETAIDVIKTKLDMIDSRGCNKSVEAIAELNAKVNKTIGAASVLGIIFSSLLAKVGLK